jgi:hypothetical protein
MAIAYRQPSVTVSETVDPTISPLLAAPALIGIVGLSQGFQTRTDQFALTGTTAIALPGLPAGATVTSVDSVKDAVDPSKGTNGSYTLTTDYTVQTAAGTITRVGAGGIADGAAVNVTYKYIPADYWSPIRQFDLGSVETRFGPSLDSTGTTINSPVSYAAMIAFENGADSVVIQPLFKRTTPGDPTSAPTQPDATQAAALSTWQDTFYAIRDIEDINVLVPIIGQSMTNVGDSVQLSIMQAAQDHVQFMMQQQQYLVTVLGEDASASNTVAQKATLLSQTLDDQVIGNLIADNNAPNVVASTVAAVLDGLVRGNDIVDYGGVDARYLSLDPTTIEVRFAYRPAMPVNYINIVFSLDLTTGQLTTDGSTSDILGGT